MHDIVFAKLREATLEAATDIAWLLPQLSSTPKNFDVDMLSAMLSQPRCYTYVALRHTHIVGMLTIVGYIIPTGTKWQLEDVVLDASLRGQGIARELIVWALDDFRRHQPDASIHLTSRPSRVAANALYRSLGFKPKDTNNYVIEKH